MFFDPKIMVFAYPPVYEVPSPSIYGPQKASKNADKTPGFETNFWSFFQYIRQNPRFWTPPKIIKNRLNFALSEKFMNSRKNRDF